MLFLEEIEAVKIVYLDRFAMDEPFMLLCCKI
ncbi:MAG: hypothetical protein GPOALKHO_000166 [Sodalis sp.]|nr:MAG: hypothetical protein GPOALKHO_000166 [Sodalis sp.]